MIALRVRFFGPKVKPSVRGMAPLHPADQVWHSLAHLPRLGRVQRNSTREERGDRSLQLLVVSTRQSTWSHFTKCESSHLALRSWARVLMPTRVDSLTWGHGVGSRPSSKGAVGRTPSPVDPITSYCLWRKIPRGASRKTACKIRDLFYHK